VHEEDVTTGYGIAQLDAKDFESGQYVFELILNNQTVASSKFQIIK
jgi:hypothetical protein